jgi:hypothetical protein
MRDNHAVPTGTYGALHDTPALDSTARETRPRVGKESESQDGKNPDWRVRPMLPGSALQRLGRYAGPRIAGPSSSSAAVAQ